MEDKCLEAMSKAELIDLLQDENSTFLEACDNLLERDASGNILRPDLFTSFIKIYLDATEPIKREFYGR